MNVFPVVFFTQKDFTPLFACLPPIENTSSNHEIESNTDELPVLIVTDRFTVNEPATLVCLK